MQLQIVAFSPLVLFLQVLHTLIGQMELTKHQSKILEPKYKGFKKTINPKTDPFNCVSLLNLKNINHCHVYMLHHMKSFSICNLSSTEFLSNSST